MEDRSHISALTQDQFEELSECLAQFAVKLGVSAVFLVTGSGEILAKKVRPGWTADDTVLSTLAAGSFAAANEMASVLNEPANFEMVLHEGRTRNVFVCNVNGSFFLIVIFEKGVALGLVRLFTRKTVEKLIPVLSRKQMAPLRTDNLFDDRFGSLLDDALDRSLKEKSS